MTQAPTTYKSVYHIGATNGITIGVLLSAMFLCQTYGLRSFPLLLLGYILMLAVPFVAYRILVRDHDRYSFLRSVSGIWLDGIVTFICGSITLAVVMYIFLRYIEPGFTVEQIHNVATLYRELHNPQADAMAKAMEQLITTHQVPSPIQLAFSMLWLTSFVGAMLSMVLALIIRFITRRKVPKDFL